MKTPKGFTAKEWKKYQTLVNSFTNAVTVTGGKNVHTKGRVRRKVQKQEDKPEERT
jgi:hypothetical protein